MKIHWNAEKKVYWAEFDGAPFGSSSERKVYWDQKEQVKAVGFFYDSTGEASGERHRWYSKYLERVEPLAKYAVGETVDHLRERNARIEASRQADVEDGFSVPATEGQRYLPFQLAGIKYMMNTKKCLLGDEMGLGKQHPVDTKVLTPDGWKEIGSVSIGDRVIGSNGRPTTVTGVYPQGTKPSYRVYFSDGSSVESGPEHLWTVRFRRGINQVWEDITLTTDQLRLRPRISRKHSNGRTTELDLSKTPLYLPILSAPVEFSPQGELPVDAYTVGALIANGGLQGTSAVVSVNTRDAVEFRESMPGDGAIGVYGGTTRWSVKGAISHMRELGLAVPSRVKFIPEVYLRASVKDRIDLLQGLMDCDGSVSKTNNRLTYHTISEALARDFQGLVECLGGIASISKYDRSHDNKPTEYRVRLRLPGSIKPFRVSRKAGRYNPGSHASPVRTVVRVEYVRDVESVCISVEAPDSLYATEHAILTHNTVQLLGLVNACPDIQNVLVICPASMRITWYREALKWLTRDFRIFTISKNTEVPEDVNFVVAGWSNVAQSKVLNSLTSRKWDLVVVDECHYAKNSRSAKRAKAVLGDHRYDRIERKEVLAESGIIHCADRVVFSTGTPLVNRPVELFPFLRVIDPDGLGQNFFGYAKRYCGAHHNGISWDFSGATNLSELQRRLRGSAMIRRLKSDVMGELPPKRRTLIPVSVGQSAETKRIIASISKKSEKFSRAIQSKDYESAVRDLMASSALFEEISLLRHQVGLDKCSSVIEFVKEALETEDKIIVFAHHRDVQESIAEELREYGVVQVMGGMSDTVKQGAVDQFQTDPSTRVFVGSLEACREGLTLTAASTVVFAELAWTPSAVSQAEDRAHRYGQEYVVNVYHVVLDESLDSYIVQTIVEKQNNIDATLDNTAVVKEVEVSEEMEEEVAKFVPPQEEKVSLLEEIKAGVTDKELEAPPF
jgi:SWI/SNF-related matrix-associated actin-dependent regulator 1 of chromatin subfamily A